MSLLPIEAVPRQGRHGIDNGFIQFTNVRIPRTNMLMKHTQVCVRCARASQRCASRLTPRRPRHRSSLPHNRQVSSDGKVTEPPMAQLTYGALIGGRVQMVMGTVGRR